MLKAYCQKLQFFLSDQILIICFFVFFVWVVKSYLCKMLIFRKKQDGLVMPRNFLSGNCPNLNSFPPEEELIGA